MGGRAVWIMCGRAGQCGTCQKSEAFCFLVDCFLCHADVRGKQLWIGRYGSCGHAWNMCRLVGSGVLKKVWKVRANRLVGNAESRRMQGMGWRGPCG